jgi:hypothetical protein
MKKQEFLLLLAQFIQETAKESDSEPYRNAGDRLVDEALALID